MAASGSRRREAASLAGCGRDRRDRHRDRRWLLAVHGRRGRCGLSGPDPTRQREVADGIARAVNGWLATLDAGQRARATFPFETPERTAWRYVPGTRAGLSFADMRPGQRDAARAIIRVALSDRTSVEVAAVIDLETILGELERASGRQHHERDPERYWFAVFGDPDARAPWAWRVEGHHVSIHQALADGRVVGSTPSFVGANPATVPSGPSAGVRALVGEEALARALLGVLSPEQRTIAIVDPVAPPDILSGTGPRADVRRIPTGIRHDQLDAAQAAGLESLVRHYLDRARPEVADADWERVVDAGLAPVTFAWAGPDEPGRGHYYAVRGPRFLIEYDNTQNGANHIHSVWRDLTNDWGEDLLATHYRAGHPAT